MCSIAHIHRETLKKHFKSHFSKKDKYVLLNSPLDESTGPTPPSLAHKNHQEEVAPAPHNPPPQPQSALQFPPELYKVNCMINTSLHIILCIECEIAISPSEIQTHLDKHKSIADSNSPAGQHHKERFTFDKGCLDQLQMEFNLVQTVSSSINPMFGGAYVEGLSVHDGMVCTACNTYACVKSSTMEKHYKISHQGTGYSSTSYSKAVVQRFNERTTYFSVVAETPQVTDMFELVQRAYKLQTHHNEDFQAPNSVREVVPFLQVTGWLDFLGTWYTDAAKRKTIIELVEQPRFNLDAALCKMTKLCTTYLGSAREHCKSAHDLVRKSLIKYPA